MAKRIERVNELIKEVASEIILRTIQFPDGTLVTVTRAAASPDIHYANVFITALSPKEEPEKEALAILRAHTPDIQRELNRKLRMRPVPRILFLMDKEEGKREKIEKLLGENKKRPAS